jgi:hypothetical protein
MLQARPHAIHFKRILDFGEGQDLELPHRHSLGQFDCPPATRGWYAGCSITAGTQIVRLTLDRRQLALLFQ